MRDLFSRWRSEGVGLQPGASPDELASIESLLGTSLPGDVRAFYAAANGMEDFDHDQWFVSLWSTHRMCSEKEIAMGTDDRGAFLQVAFADVMISSCFFWFRMREPGGISVFAELTDEEFPSLSAFLERFAEDPESLGLSSVEIRPPERDQSERNR